MSQLRKRFIRDMRIRNYSDHTIRHYVMAVEHLSVYYRMCPSEISGEQIKDYLGSLLKNKNSWSHVSDIWEMLRYKVILVQTAGLTTDTILYSFYSYKPFKK